MGQIGVLGTRFEIGWALGTSAHRKRQPCLSVSPGMAGTQAAYAGMPLPRSALHVLSSPLHAMRASRQGYILPSGCTRAPVRAMARRVSDIKFYPENTKEERRARRVREKKEARHERERQRGTQRGFGDRQGIGFGSVGSSKRTEDERQARLKYIEGKPGTREIAQRVSQALSGGKADLLLHTLRARWLERMECLKFNEDIALTDDVKRLYLRLIDEILFCDKLYYADNPKPRVSDENYDELVMHLIELERFFPELICQESPSQNVAHGAAVRSSKLGLDNEVNWEPMTALASSLATVPVTEKRFAQYRHKSLMLSLDNAYKHDDLVSFARRASEANTKLSAELKIDGIALSLEYRNRRLVSAATRGNGRIGDEVTENVRAALLGRGVVESIEDPAAPGYLVVRGEVYIAPLDFEVVNTGLEKSLSNPRNAAAGALKHKDPKEAKARLLRFVAYECLTGSLQAVEASEEPPGSQKTPAKAALPFELHAALPTQDEMFKCLVSWGFGEMPRHAVCDSIDDAEAFAIRVEEERQSLPMEVDGAVFKFEDSHARENAGHTARAPRGAIAYKFAAQSKVTKVEDVVMQVSRNGLITPVAVLKPVRVGGALLSRATLHNFDEINRLEVAVGDQVRIERGGDVIPKIVKVEKRSDSTDRKPVKPPTECPSCHGAIDSKVDKKTGATLVSCQNVNRCSAQMLGRLVHFCGKDAMDVKGLGKKTANKLISSGLVVVYADLFRLTLDDLLTLEGFAERSAKVLLESIREASTERSLERLIFGLGFPGVGRTGARALAAELKSLEKLLELAMNNGIEKLLGIPNFAEKSAQVVHSHLQLDRTQSDIKAMLELVTPNCIVEEEVLEEIDQSKDLSSVTGKSFVFTGKLSMMSRPEVKKWIRSAGGVVGNDVSTRTDYVVVGLDPGHKFFKAQRLKVKTLQEEEFLELFKRAGLDVQMLMAKE